MTISSSTRTAGPFLGDGSTTALPFGFKVFATTDVLVQRTSADGAQLALTLGGDYTVALNADQNAAPGGVVTLLDPAADFPTGSSITLTSAVAATQPLSLANGGPFLAKSIEDALDRLTLLQQQQALSLDGAIRAPLVETLTELPAATARRGKMMAFDASTGDLALTSFTESQVVLAIEAAYSAGSIGLGVNVVDFGADPTGATDSTSAINATIAYLASKSVKRLVFPDGIFLISAALTPLTGSNWTVQGAGQHSTIIRSTANDRIFASDARTAGIYWHEYRDMTLERVAATPYESSVGVVVLGDTGSVTGLQYATFAGLRFNNLYRGIVVQDTGKYTSGAFVNNTRHGFFVFKDLVSAFSSDAMYECVVFEGGTGPHHTFIGGQIRGSNAAIRLGTAGGDAGIGDLTFVGLHVVTAGVGLDIYGPSGATTYNQNITVTGCQFDNCSTATVRMDKMQNCRIGLNNSTSIVGVTLTNCTNIVREDRNAFTFQNVSMEGTLTTTAGSIADTNGTRISQRAAFRRTVADSSMLITGGNISNEGARFELFGQSHASTPDTISMFADNYLFNNDSGLTAFIEARSNYARIGDGAWNGIPLRLGAYYLWVDSTGDLRIKGSAPSSDTDGAIVGTQS